MIKEKLDRINELAHLAKERDLLRREYIAEWRLGAQQVLENTYLVDEHGNKRPLPKKKK